jgi:TM2 domain-containing membrane protein YozV
VGIDGWIEFVLNWAAVPVGLFAFIHAGLQKGEAFTAANKRTKPFWMAVTGGSTLACALFHFYDYTLMFWIAGLVAILVYIVDVKPKVVEVQRGSQW